MFNVIQSIVRAFRGEVSTKRLVKRGLKVGNNFNRQGYVIIDPPHCWLIEIGDNVTLATGVYILAHDASTSIVTNYTKIGNVKIGNNVFVGAHSIILPGVTIGDNCIIGAGSVVTRDIPSNTVAAGNPAKSICSTNDFKDKIISKMKNDNCFNEDYTMRKKVDKTKKQIQKEKLKKNHIGFTK